jgi:hypothetical protein
VPTSPYQRAQTASAVLQTRLRAARRARHPAHRPADPAAARRPRLQAPAPTLPGARGRAVEQDTDLATLQRSAERIAAIGTEMARQSRERASAVNQAPKPAPPAGTHSQHPHPQQSDAQQQHTRRTP